MGRALVLLALVPAVTSCQEGDATPVRATLADGQVLAGELRTDTLFLESGLGTLPIPLADVGEVLPVEGGQLEGSGGYVTVWLRNGSEFRGRWADPELQMDLAIGGEALAVDLPVADLTRFQLQGGELWPEAPVFRVRTHMGDDFLVDPEASRIVLSNELGTFSPWLSECASILPGADGWTLRLHNGTVLIGEMDEAELEFQLAVGPEEVSVPLDTIASMQWESWGDDSNGWGALGNITQSAAGMPAAAAPEAMEEQAAKPAAKSRRSVDNGDGWFSNQRLYDAKH